ncbi:hypothetical protein OEZ85_006160 [Tetradesmus obliquus]|uniref:Tyrosine-protein kinase ephrin type A/B receptor-like domain-containing protein n=1 Tax=Tetradesmus obliquus TaxID=3088 RepID=A0ABY8UL28_TETOB|nr:hypothetical protein OEZ85_006160 [Tetradesmus obliquus]
MDLKGCWALACCLFALAHVADAATVSPTSTVSVCDMTDGSGGTASCGNKGVISVTSATFGRAADSRCIAMFTRSTCAVMDVTSKARSLCDGKSSCNVTLSAFGLSSSTICSDVWNKELAVSYTCTGGASTVVGNSPTSPATATSCAGLPPALPLGWAWPSSCSGAAVGTVCKQTCPLGLLGSVSSNCTSSGAWSGATGACLSVACSSRPSSTPANAAGWPASCAPAAAGDVCTANCSTGFIGRVCTTCSKLGISSSCSSSGAWSSPQGSCSQVTCPGLPTQQPPANSIGWPATCAGLAAGQTCGTKCAEGYTGELQSTCSAAGSWSSVAGSCTQVTCAGTPTQEQPANSQPWPASCAGQAVGQVCATKCAEGFTGQLVSSCSTTGAWSPVEGVCQPAICPGLPTQEPPANSAAWLDTCAGMAIGQTCSTSCAEGYEGQLISSCSTAGEWSPVEGICQQATCPGLPTQEQPANSQPWPASCAGMAAGQACATKCAEGFSGMLTSGCYIGEGWSPVEGRCEQITCTGLPPPAANSAGFPGSCSGQPYQALCAAPCAPGFSGGVSSTCGEDGQWSEVEGACALVFCKAPPPPAPNALWPANCAGMGSSATCRSTCSEGFSGALSTTCTANGTWSAVEGSCTQITCAGVPTLTPIANTTGWPDACLQQPYGSVCVSRCAAGYVGTNLTSTCKADGTWSQPGGTCYLPFCPGMPPAKTPAYGTGWPANCTNLLANSACRQACAPGYSGSLVTRCFSNATWAPGFRGNCTRDTCQGLPAASTQNDTAGWPSSCSGAAVSDSCSAPCAAGWSGPGYKATCQAKNTWGAASGSCTRDRCSRMPTDATPTSAGWPPSCANITSGSSCRAPCDSPFGPGYSIQCSGKDSWAAPTGTCPEICSGPPTAEPPEDSRGWGASCANGNVVGFRCIAGCAPSFKGRYVSSCLGKNQWGEVAGSWEPLCKDVHRGCATCRSVRVPGSDNSTELQCSTCFAGWRLRRDGVGKTCDCSAGFMMNGTADADSSWCVPCPRGQYCPGGGADGNPDSRAFNCTPGLATISEGARSEQQCYTMPGYGRSITQNDDRGTVKIDVFICPIGTYNVGGNTVGCTKCGTGLTTTKTGATNSTACVAPPGSFADMGASAKTCPRGTYTPDFNSLPACLTCPAGITTVRDNSTSIGHSKLARKGYYLVNATAAEECPMGSYQGREAEVYKCDECPYGYQTRVEGAGGNAECMAPPGVELQEGAEWVSECGLGSYKEGWNKNPCRPCGNGLTTAAAGSVSAEQCLIPAGWGTGEVKVCPPGTYNAGYNRKPCQECGTGFTSIEAGGEDEDACVVQSGWAMDIHFGIPKPCDVGTYSTGGTTDTPNAECVPCPAGLTTQKDEADSEEDCDVCVAGHGGANCTACPYDTFSTGVHKRGDACMPCAPHTVSARGSRHNSECLPELVDSDNDYFPLSNDSAWDNHDGVDSALDCGMLCVSDSACVMYRYSTDVLLRKCQLLLEAPDGGQAIALKADSAGTGYAVYRVDANLKVGVRLSDEGSKTPEECMKACSGTNACELAALDAAALPGSAGPCVLYGSTLDSDWVGMYHVHGSKLFADMMQGSGS